MALGSSLLATVLLALTVAATPVQIDTPLVSLPLVRRTNSTNLANLLSNDQARARNLKDRSHAKLGGRDGSVDVTNVAVTYVASVSQCGVLFMLRVLSVLHRRLASVRPLPSVSNAVLGGWCAAD